MARKLTVLRLLAQHEKGLYGSEMVVLADGKLNRGTVYLMLEQMIGEGLVREVRETHSVTFQLIRTRHFITAQGMQVYRSFLSEHQEMAQLLLARND